MLASVVKCKCTLQGKNNNAGEVCTVDIKERDLEDSSS